jgi:formate hydrogenlyase transcriptional activator
MDKKISLEFAKKFFSKDELWQLMEINKAITQAKTAVELLSAIRKKVVALIPFFDTGILIVENDGLHHYDLSVNISGWDDSPANILLQQNKELFKVTHPGSYTAFIMSELEQKGLPLIENWENTFKLWEHPFFPIVKEAGYKESIVALLKAGGRIYGTLWLNSPQKNNFNTSQFPLFEAVAEQVSIAVANIIAKEEIIKREKEKNILLEITTLIAQVKGKEALLKLIVEKIKPLFNFHDCGLFIISKDGENHSDLAAVLPDVSISDWNEKIASLSIDIPHKNSLVAWMINEIELSNQSVLFDFKDLAAKFPLYPQLDGTGILEMGYRDCLATTLSAGGQMIGMFCINALSKNFFSQNKFKLFESVSDSIAIAMANILANEEIVEREKEKEQLLEISEAIATVQNSKQLLKVICEKIKPVLDYDNAGLFILSNDGNNVYEITDAEILPDDIQAELQLKNLLGPFAMDGLTENFWFYYKEPSITTFKLQASYITNSTGKKHFEIAIGHGLKEFICGPLHCRGKKIGMLCFNTKKENFYNDKHINFFKSISNLIAIAVANILANEEIIEREKEKTKLLSITQAIANIQTKKELIDTIEQTLQPSFGFDEYSITVVDENKKYYKHLYTDALKIIPEASKQKGKSWQPVAGDPHELLYHAEQPATMLWERSNHLEKYTATFVMQTIAETNLQQNMITPLVYSNKIIGGIEFMTLKKDFFTPQYFPLFEAVAIQIAAAVKNILANEEIILLNKQLKAQNEYLTEEVEEAYNFEEMIGQNPKFKDACKNIGLVAKTDSSVLILGETGTGKELVARAIHNYSPRKNKPLIKLNCAALPANLIESELFGHERGAFTGAIERRIGKFELANGSTLFLDEIGELPLELQAKLLRALQEKEVERLGSNKVISIDVRIIAATNRDLMKEVQGGKFRQDLYYRLHIFPITLPPLRERKEDIPLLASHFIQKYAKKIGKNIQGFSHTAMQEIMRYNWPGNIRELEHVIERSTILAKTKLVQELDLPLASKTKIAATPDELVIKPWQQQERDYILAVLKVTNGNVKGKGGAAELLELPPTTLQSKMNKLGIKRKHYIE